MKILIIGMGGIGSFLIEEICKCIEQQQIDTFTKIDIADYDIVELKQKDYQNFSVDDVGENKAQALAERFKDYGLKAIKKKITQQGEIRKYDLIILCVDNERIRKLVIETSFELGGKSQFIDLRADGRRIFAMPKEKKIEENMKFVDVADQRHYSCQEEKDLKLGRIQKGNKIVAILGTQMVLNYLRGHNNRVMTMVI